MYKCRGAISIFMVIVLMASFLFGGFFIDASRILTAERMLNNAMNAAARSVLAEYDSKLIGEYGLYGFDNEKAKKTFSRYLYSNLALTEDENLNLFQFEIDESTLMATGSAPTMDDVVLKRQITEYSKYSAPINITVDLVDKLSKIFTPDTKKAMKKAKENADGFEAYKERVNRIKNNIKSSAKLAVQNQLNSTKSKLSEYIQDKVNPEPLEQQIKDDFKKILKNLDEIEEKQIKELTKEKDSYKEESKLAGEELQAALNEASAGLMVDAPEEDEEASNWKPSKDIADPIKETENKIQALRDQVEEARKKVRSLSEQTLSLLEKLKTATNTLKEQEESLQELNDEYDSLLSSSDDEDEIESIKEKITAKEEAIEETEDTIDSLKTQIDNKLKSVEDIEIAGVGNLDAPKDDDISDVLGLDIWKALEDLYNELNKTMPEFAGAASEDDPTEKIGIIKRFNVINGMFDKITNLLTNIRDDMYLVDYIMETSTFLTSPTNRDHYFKIAEVEYILSGNTVQGQNLVKAIGNIMVLRFVIDTVYYLVKNSPEAASFFPWIIHSLGQASIQTGKDLTELIVTGEGCRIIPSIKQPRIQYSDHLKLFLLLNGSERNLHGLKNLISKNLPETPSKNLCTRITLEAEVKMNLLILPMFNLNALNNSKFKNGKYILSQKVTVGY